MAERASWDNGFWAQVRATFGCSPLSGSSLSRVARSRSTPTEVALPYCYPCLGLLCFDLFLPGQLPPYRSRLIDRRFVSQLVRGASCPRSSPDFAHNPIFILYVVSTCPRRSSTSSGGCFAHRATDNTGLACFHRRRRRQRDRRLDHRRRRAARHASGRVPDGGDLEVTAAAHVIGHQLCASDPDHGFDCDYGVVTQSDSTSCRHLVRVRSPTRQVEGLGGDQVL